MDVGKLHETFGMNLKRRPRGLIDGGAHNRLSSMFEHVFRKNGENERGMNKLIENSSMKRVMWIP